MFYANYFIVPSLRKTMGDTSSGRIYFKMACMMSITPDGMAKLDKLLDEPNYQDNDRWDDYADWDERVKDLFKVYSTNPDIFYLVMRDAVREESELTTKITQN